MIFCGHCGAQNPQSDRFCFSCGYALSTVTVSTPASSILTGQLPTHTLLRQRYRVLQTVGQGGMGAVYLAQDTSLGDRLVAIKEMSQSNNQQGQDAIDSFKREAYLLASLQHPNLPSIYDHFEESERWYLVMSFIQGETLEDYLSHTQGQKLPLEEALRIGQDLCTVLNYLHTHQPPIIFRDLKPGNIMRSTDGHIYLIDFGIARHFKPGQAKDTANYGSAGYAPPEQYGKAQTTERSDIYSLGATLYEMISGYDPSLSPFRFPPLQSLVPTLPERLVKLITQMLDLDEGKRPASIKVVQQELQQANILAPSGLRSRMQSRSARPIPPLTPTLRKPTPQLMLSVPAQGRQVYLPPQQQGKSKTTAALLCFFLGWAGVHRFYVGKPWSGLAQLFTFGGFGIWWLIDFIMILTGNFKDSNGVLLVSVPMQGRQVYLPLQQQGKSKTTAALLCFFLGWAGVHRFYVGKPWSGLAQLFTFGGFGIWWLIDFIMILTGNFKDSNGVLLVSVPMQGNQIYLQPLSAANAGPTPAQQSQSKQTLSIDIEINIEGLLSLAKQTLSIVKRVLSSIPIKKIFSIVKRVLSIIGMILGGLLAVIGIIGILFGGGIVIGAFIVIIGAVILWFSRIRSKKTP
jgi:TM2 domain-containing membrane protein YozV